MSTTISLGFAVGTGEPVEIPLAHTFVTGQTQLSGKTTTLRAIVGRSGCRALAFVTKRGEQFEGRRIAPYLPREGEQPIHWRLVETILASALGQRSLKYERLWIVNAAKGARSLADVRRNVDRLKAKAKGNSGDVYMLLGEYLDLVLPEMQSLAASDVLDLAPGLNVMDLGGVGPQLQALVIRAALERINQHEKGVLTVFPEAWEFAPRGRSAPAKDEAIAMARKGAVLGNYLLCDSQDIAGVDTVIRQAASVWVLGVQRELNELKRTIDSIPAGIAKPKAADVATLGVGQFYACWGRSAIKTYVQPAWMSAEEAREVATGRRVTPNPPTKPAGGWTLDTLFPTGLRGATDPSDDDTPPTDEDLGMADLKRIEEKLDQLLERRPAPTAHAADAAPAPTPAAVGDEEALYQRIKARLVKEAPALIRVLATRSEIEVKVDRQVIEVGGDSLRGRLALLVREGFFDSGATGYAAWKELGRRGANPAKVSVYTELKELARLGFLTREGDEGYRTVPDMKANIKK